MYLYLIIFLYIFNISRWQKIQQRKGVRIRVFYLPKSNESSCYIDRSSLTERTLIMTDYAKWLCVYLLLSLLIMCISSCPTEKVRQNLIFCKFYPSQGRRGRGFSQMEETKLKYKNGTICARCDWKTWRFPLIFDWRGNRKFTANEEGDVLFFRRVRSW